MVTQRDHPVILTRHHHDPKTTTIKISMNYDDVNCVCYIQRLIIYYQNSTTYYYTKTIIVNN